MARWWQLCVNLTSSRFGDRSIRLEERQYLNSDYLDNISL